MVYSESRIGCIRNNGMPSTVFASRVFTATLAACTLSGCTESTVPRAGPVDASVTTDGGGPDVAYARESSAGFAAAESSLNNNSDASVSDAAPEAAPVLVGVDDWDPTQLDSYDEVALQSGLGELLRYGRGAAAVDVDGDGDDDIFVADGDNRWRGTWGSPEIFLNDGFGNFTRTDLGISDTDTTATWGGAFADFDNDGDPDLLIVSGGYSLPSTLLLFENCISDGDGFQDVTAKLGIAPDSGLSDLFEWWGASWADYDLDGYLDVIATRRNRGPALFHNNQGTGFTEVGASVGLTLEDDKDYKNPTWIDYDEDGDPDLYLAGSLAHAFYRNDSGLFMEVTDSVFTQGLIVPSRMSFAAAAADFDQDGHDDLYLGRWDYQDYVLFGDGAGGFEFVGAEGGLDAALAHNDNPSEPYENTMGLGIGDIHDDGYPDIVVGSGDPEETGPDIIYCNARDRSFFRCTDLFVETNDDPRPRGGVCGFHRRRS